MNQPASKPPLISIIIVTYNSSSTIAACLKSLLSQSSDGKDIEVIIVDNASTDTTRKTISADFPQVTLIENKTNVGFAAAVNQGAAAAKGAHFLLLNPDTLMQNTFIRRLADFLHGNHQAAVAGCNLVDREGKHQPSCWKKPTLSMLLLETFLPCKVSLPLVTDNPPLLSEVKMVSGACMAIKRDVFERVGGFDEQFFIYYEDADFCFRARKAGYKVFFNPAISVFHEVGGSSADQTMMFLHLYQSKTSFFEKHYPGVTSVIAKAVIRAGILVRIPLYWMAAKLLFNQELLRLSKVHNFVRMRM